MPRSIYFISHPNVQISATVPVPQWPLSELGRQRMENTRKLPWINNISSIYSSTEQKAMGGAVGTLLYCYYANVTIDRRWDQPGNGGGNYLRLTLSPNVSCHWWKAID